MGVEKVILTHSVKAGEDLSATQFTLVEITSEATLVKSSGSGAKTVQFVQADATVSGSGATSEYVTINVAGIAKLKCSNEVKAGVLVVVGNNGEGKAAAGGSLQVIGLALETIKAGSIGTILVTGSLTTA